jgi:pimeloyl-ACP methyl ester carboxylesterase
MTASENHQVTVPGGRSFAVRDLGEPGAPAVLFNPGFMGCRLTGRAAPGARVITIDRPGIGGSSPSPRRRLLDWPDDVAAVADKLGLDRFAVLGHSAGGPYAAACALKLGDRVSALGIACGFAPLRRPGATEGMSPRMAQAASALRRAPWLAGVVTRSLPRQYRKDPAQAFDRQFGRDLPPCDRAALADPAALRPLLAAAVESTRQGAAPLALETRVLFAQEWGFAPADVKTPTQLWYGAEDTLTPPAMGRYLAQEIPGAQLTVFPGEGHMAAFTHWDAIVAALLG